MNDIIQGLALILGGKALSGSKNKGNGPLYEEYKYSVPFRLPQLYDSEYGNTFVYHKGKLYRNNAESYANTIINVLRDDFGVEYVLAQATTGSTVCKIKLRPINNIKKAFRMEREIKFALNREDARVYNEGSYVVIEISNTIETVRFGDFMHDKRFNEFKSKTVVPIGQSTDGKIEYADIAKMPHMLVAGTTGSGKSVFLNTIITALLMKNTPDDIQMFLIDPKMVEFKPMYKSLRYVHCIDEASEAIRLTSDLVSEMEFRYDFLGKKGCRDIDSFNERYPNNKMPRIIIVVDELADLMKSDYGKGVEKNLIRIAQKARACGIHMILATQRPTKDVVTGLIKANIPCRVALSVTSKVDSMVILDRVGAENLLGNGDMLFLDGKNNKVAKRLQGGFIEQGEISNVVVELIRDNQPKDYERAFV